MQAIRKASRPSTINLSWQIAPKVKQFQLSKVSAFYQRIVVI